jgi:hypothetical protein
LCREEVPSDVVVEVTSPAGAHARLTGEVKHAVDLAHEAVEGSVDQVETGHLEAGGVLGLPGRRVVVREAVHGQDVVAAGEELLRQVGSDEAGRAGDQVPHRAASWTLDISW